MKGNPGLIELVIGITIVIIASLALIERMDELLPKPVKHYPCRIEKQKLVCTKKAQPVVEPSP